MARSVSIAEALDSMSMLNKTPVLPRQTRGTMQRNEAVINEDHIDKNAAKTKQKKSECPPMQNPACHAMPCQENQTIRSDLATHGIFPSSNRPFQPSSCLKTGLGIYFVLNSQSFHAVITKSPARKITTPQAALPLPPGQYTALASQPRQ